jgi:hypothetical protein
MRRRSPCAAGIEGRRIRASFRRSCAAETRGSAPSHGRSRHRPDACVDGTCAASQFPVLARGRAIAVHARLVPPSHRAVALPASAPKNGAGSSVDRRNVRLTSAPASPPHRHPIPHAFAGLPSPKPRKADGFSVAFGIRHNVSHGFPVWQGRKPSATIGPAAALLSPCSSHMAMACWAHEAGGM